MTLKPTCKYGTALLVNCALAISLPIAAQSQELPEVSNQGQFHPSLLMLSRQMNERNRQIFRWFVSCVVESELERSRTLLILPYEEQTDHVLNEMKNGRIHNCLMSGEINFSLLEFTGQITRELIERSVSPLDPVLTSARNPLEMLAFCVLEADAETNSFLATVDASAAEREKFEALVSASSQCFDSLSGLSVLPGPLKSLLISVTYNMGIEAIPHSQSDANARR